MYARRVSQYILMHKYTLIRSTYMYNANLCFEERWIDLTILNTISSNENCGRWTFTIATPSISFKTYMHYENLRFFRNPVEIFVQSIDKEWEQLLTVVLLVTGKPRCKLPHRHLKRKIKMLRWNHSRSATWQKLGNFCFTSFLSISSAGEMCDIRKF